MSIVKSVLEVQDKSIILMDNYIRKLHLYPVIEGCFANRRMFCSTAKWPYDLVFQNYGINKFNVRKSLTCTEDHNNVEKQGVKWFVTTEAMEIFKTMFFLMLIPYFQNLAEDSNNVRILYG